MRPAIFLSRIAVLALSVNLAFVAPATAEDSLSDAEFGERVRAYLLSNPDVIREALLILEQKRALDEARAEQEAMTALEGPLYDDGFSWVGGNPEGSITMVEFLDYRCGYCKRAHNEVAELVESDGDIRLIVKEFPILGPDSVTASRAAIATLLTQGPDAYKKMNDALMTFSGPINDSSLDRIARSAGIDMKATRGKMDDPEVSRRIQATRELAQELQISGTPTFVLGGQMIRGYIPLSDMKSVVEMTRKDG